MNILVIDDIQYNLTLLEKNLQKIGHTVFTCTDTEEALKTLSRGSIEAVFCDYNLETENGIEFRHRCHQKIYVEKGIRLPAFILFSAFSDEALESEALKSGFIDCIKKPFSMCDVEAVLKHASDYSSTTETSTKHALIISSTPTIKQMIEKNINKQAISVKWVTSVAEAINYYAYHAQVDYIICDQTIDNYDASDVYSLCKANPRMSDSGLVEAPPCYVVLSESREATAEDYEQYRNEVCQKGIKEVLWPPLSPIKLSQIFNLEIEENTATREIDQKILVIDDSAFSRAIIVNRLKKVGHTVVEAANGTSAIDLLKNDISIHLVISDLNLPDINGDEVMHSIQKMKRYDLTQKEINCPPFVLVTSAKDTELESGDIVSDEYRSIMQKPVDLESLAGLSKKVLREQMAKMW